MFKIGKSKKSEVDETTEHLKEQLEELQASIKKIEKKVKTLEKEESELEKTVATQSNIIQVLDSGVFLSVYSLLQDKKVKFPAVKTPDDVVNTGVSENIGRMMEIIKSVNEKVAETTKATKTEKKSKK